MIAWWWVIPCMFLGAAVGYVVGGLLAVQVEEQRDPNRRCPHDSART